MEETQLDGTSTEIKDPVAVLAALDRAKKDAKQFREDKERLEAELNQFKTQASTVQSKLMSEKINRHLAGLGINNGDRLMKYIKTDSLSLSEDFEVLGLDEQIDSLKSDFPELFDPKIIVGGKADGGNLTPLDAKLSASQIQAKLVLGR
jgi:hypothetical protein